VNFSCFLPNVQSCTFFRLLTNAKQRLGRRNVMEITDHPFFDGVNWRTLPDRKVIILFFLRILRYHYIAEVAPTGLHLPQFTYTEPKIAQNIGATGNDPPAQYEESLSQGFPFSAFFQPSSSGFSTNRPRPSPGPVSGNPSNSVLRSSLSTAAFDSTSSASSFIGFSWGPLADAFPPALPTSSANPKNQDIRPTLIPVPNHETPAPVLYHSLLVPTSGSAGGSDLLSTPRPFTNNTPYNYSTPRRPYALSPYHTLQRTSTIRRSNAPRRSVSDREAMKQLVDCVGMSARKKVLESGRKPRVIGVWSLGGRSGMKGEGMGKSSYKKELRFDPLATPIPRPDYGALGPSSGTGSITTSRSHRNSSNHSHTSSNAEQRNNQPWAYAYSSEDTNTDSEDGVGPPSPSPSPRPGSAMSMISMSRRSGTPTTATLLTMSNSTVTGTLSSHRAGGNSSVTGTGYLSIPSAMSAGALNLDGFLPGSAVVDGNAGSRRNASLAIPRANRHSNAGSRKQSGSLPRPVFRSGSRTRDSVQDHDDYDGSGRDVSCLTRSHQWDELEMRHAAMMGDIEDLEERFQGLNASLMDGC
jgi:hypothetical protein